MKYYDRIGDEMYLNDDGLEEAFKNYSSPWTQNYSKGYLAYIDPRDYLSLTASNPDDFIKDNEFDEKRFDGSGKYFYPMMLDFDPDTGDVLGHEGRHRMGALANAGVKRVPVVMNLNGNNTEKWKNNARTLNNFTLKGQNFSDREYNGMRGPNLSGRKVKLESVVPFSEGTRKTLEGERAKQKQRLSQPKPVEQPKPQSGEKEKAFELMGLSDKKQY